MNHLFTTLPFIAYSAVIIMLLANTDHRRRQLHARNNDESSTLLSLKISSRLRSLLSWSLIIPVIPLVMMGNYAGILMYAGALTVLGWIISELPTSVV